MLNAKSLKWWGNDPKLCARVDAVAGSWLGTPYMEGQRARGMGADCREYVQAFLDELYGNKEGTKLPRIAADTGIHSPALASPAIRAMMLSNHGVEDVTLTSKTLEPGDIIAAAGEGNGAERREHEAHAMIVGGSPWSVYHALRLHGVVRSSIAGSGVMMLRLYRPRKKELWA